MSKLVSQKPAKGIPREYKFVRNVGDIEEYVLKSNGLKVLYHHRPETDTVTTNITYRVGARDEARGETGIAHMLEHMLFKPTTFDVETGITNGSAVQFERVSGCILNANTWKDRTTYFFNYPNHYFDQAVQIESERMIGTILTPEVLTPEQGNVLSEFDMYHGDPFFALSVAMVSTAFFSHPYGHETIGYREDIERYSAQALERFYRQYYTPDNAVFMIIGDIDRTKALRTVAKHFGVIVNSNTLPPREYAVEPTQEGIRRVTISRPTTTNAVAFGFKHAGFPTREWFITHVLFECLAGSPDSILCERFIDTGRCSAVDWVQEPTADTNLGILSFTLAPEQKHVALEADVRTVLTTLTSADLKSPLKRTVARLLTSEYFSRASSLGIARELTEYVAADAIGVYSETPTILTSITVKDLLSVRDTILDESTQTMGYIIGTSKHV